MKRIASLLLALGLSWAVSAQPSEKGTYNTQGQKDGRWETYDRDNHLVSAGFYNNGKRTGEWKFYLSPIARRVGQSDIIGNYVDGKREGAWFLKDERFLQGSMRGEFHNDKMNGTWQYFNAAKQLIAEGDFVDGLRNGTWTLYQNNKERCHGEFVNGKKTGQWKDTYFFPDETVRVESDLNYINGLANGTLQQYHIYTPKGFKTQEDLTGVGTYKDGVRTGRWVIFEKLLKGEILSRGSYYNGFKNGLWLTDLDGKHYEAATYYNDVLDGSYKSYHDNGKLALDGGYAMGQLNGTCVSYYPNGNPKEECTYTFAAEMDADTIYDTVEFPIELWFDLVGDKMSDINIEDIAWSGLADYQLSAEEYASRMKVLKNFKVKRVIKQIKQNRRVVRTGPYRSYHENGKVEYEGQYLPKAIRNYDPKQHLYSIEYQREGTWKYYDDLGYLRKTLEYSNGKLTKTKEE